MSAPAKVYLDSNVFIAAFEHEGAGSDHAWWLLEAIDAGTIWGATSELTLAEVLVKPFALGDDKLVEGYRSAISPERSFEVRRIDRDVLTDAARVRARRRAIKLPDAIHLASAKAAGCAFFVSGDARLDMPEGIVQLVLGPFVIDDIMKASK